MTPRAFRALPKQDQIEMLGHLREVSLRKNHSEHVSMIVGKLDDPTEKKDARRKT